MIVLSDEPHWCHARLFDDRFWFQRVEIILRHVLDEYVSISNHGRLYLLMVGCLVINIKCDAPKLWFGPDGQDPKDVYVDRWEYLNV